MKILRKTLHIGGMSCVNCEHRIRYVLKTAPGIQDATVSYNTGLAHVTYDTDTISLKQIREIIEKNGYTILPETGTSDYDMKKNFVSLAVILFLYALLQHFGILNLLAPGQLADTKMGYGMLFVIGLITSVHCIAMCGGINLSQCIPQPSNASDVSGSSRALDIFLPALLYNTGRVISYTAIGFLLGLVGMLLGAGTQTGISYFLQGSLKMIAGIFMVIMGINMLGIFPWLRPLTLRIPRFLSTKVLKKRAPSRQPLFVGLLNGLMPCGPLQSMQIVALACQNPFSGALSMFLFSLGTVPLMLWLGSLVSVLGKRFAKKMTTVGAILVVVLGLAMFSQGTALAGISEGPENSQNTANPQNTGTSEDQGTSTDTTDSSNAADKTPQDENANNIQVIYSTLQRGRYPDIKVQTGVPIKWIINAPKGSLNGCNYRMLLRSFGIEHTLSEGENVIEFTPSKSGTFQYTCWMGMIRGNITVTDTLETSPTDPDTSTGAEETDPETEPFFNGSGMGCCGS